MRDTELDFGAHRRRTNTAQKLEKLDLERKRVGKITNIKWEDPTNAAGEGLIRILDTNLIMFYKQN